MFGWTIDEQRSFEVLDAYVAAGGNFIDTADTYGRRGPGGAGESERIIGRWIAARGNREQLVIATKVGMSPELTGLSPTNDRAAALEASLQRLDIDRIDLYYAHKDDPRDAAGGDARGVRRADRRRADRLRGGVQLQRRATARRRCRSASATGMASYVALQPHYNLMERGEYEGELASLCERARLGMRCRTSAWRRASSRGKYRRDGEQVDSPRAQGVRERYFNERGFAVLDALDAIAAAHDVARRGRRARVAARAADRDRADRQRDLERAARRAAGVGRAGALPARARAPERRFELSAEGRHAPLSGRGSARRAAATVSSGHCPRGRRAQTICRRRCVATAASRPRARPPAARVCFARACAAGAPARRRSSSSKSISRSPGAFGGGALAPALCHELRPMWW